MSEELSMYIEDVSNINDALQQLFNTGWFREDFMIHLSDFLSDVKLELGDYDLDLPSEVICEEVDGIGKELLIVWRTSHPDTGAVSLTVAICDGLWEITVFSMSRVPYKLATVVEHPYQRTVRLFLSAYRNLAQGGDDYYAPSYKGGKYEVQC